MEQKESDRRFWNDRQTEFRQVLLSFEHHEDALQMFMRQHATLHSRKASRGEALSPDSRFFEDELLDDMAEPPIRIIPPNFDHSIAWNIWHMARIEDVTMNMLVAGEPQLLSRENWLERMKIRLQHTGNIMDRAAVKDLSAVIDIGGLRAYRSAVGHNTREIVKHLSPQELKQKVDPTRLQRVREEGAVVETASDLLEYWGRRNIAGLLLMPATRHNFVHLNEAFRLKQRL